MARSRQDRALAEAKRRQAAQERLGRDAAPHRLVLSTPEPGEEPAERLWTSSRAGARAGRGFRFQDAVATLLLCESWENLRTDTRIVPEGYDDVTIQSVSGSEYFQVKSRRESAGEYSPSEFRQILRSVADATLRRQSAGLETASTLILERSVAGIDLPALGDAPIAEPTLEEALRGLLSADDDGQAAALVNDLSIVICSDPHERAVSIVARARSVPDAVAEIVVADLRARLGAASDSNVERSRQDPAGVDLSNVDGIVDRVLETINLELLDEARALGVCESVDWSIAWDESAPRPGGQVVPAHAGAGLLIARPELAAAVLELVDARRFAVIAGPSGSGKSALAIESAHTSRATHRWQQVRSLAPVGRTGRDATSMILARVAALRPNRFSPVGVLVDDAGRHDPAVLNGLLRRLAELPNVATIVTVREEDRFAVPLLAAIATITPVLDAGFAEELWNDYRKREVTTWEGWREPYERSNGLLLEYSNLLTEGDTLEVTIRAQVAAREADPNRHLELEIIRLVSCANQYGVGVAPAAVRAALEASHGSFVAAHRRLVDEHLVIEREDGLLRPLHELRSRALADASNPFGQSDSVERLIALVPASELGRLLRRTLGHTIEYSKLLAAAAIRVSHDRSVETLVAVLSAFRLDGLHRRADEWKQVLDDCGVEASDAATAYSLSRTRPQPGFEQHFKPAIAAAMEKLRALPNQPDMDPVWKAIDIATIDEILSTHITQGGTPATLRQALSVLRGIDAKELPRSAEATAGALPSMPTEDLIDVMETLRHLDRDIADTIATSLGSDELLKRVLAETPWLASLEQVDDAVVGKWIFFDENAQPDPNGSVVEVCRRALAVAPAATIAKVSAVDARGELAMMSAKQPLVEKAIPRENLPAALEVSENRAAVRALSRKYGAGTLTGTLAAEAQLLNAIEELLPDVVHAHLTGRNLGKQSLVAVVEAMTMMWSLGQPEEPYAVDEIPGAMGDYPTESGAATTARTLLEQTIPNLIDVETSKRNPALAAMNLDRAVDALTKVVELDRYRYLPEPPNGAALLASLENLRTIAKASAAGVTQVLSAMRAAAGRSEGADKISAAATVARSHEHGALLRVAERVRRSLATTGYDLNVEPSQRDEPMISWPAGDLAMTIQDKSLPAHITELPAIADAVRELRDVPDRRTWIALRTANGYPRMSIFQVANEGVLPLGDRQPPATYASSIAPDPVSSIYEAYLRAARHCTAVAAVIAVRGSTTITDLENETLQAAWTRLLDLNQQVEAIAADHPGSEYAAGLNDIVKSIGRAITDDITTAGDRAQSGASGWDGTAELSSLELLDFSSESLQAQGPATAVYGTLIVCAEIEDDFANADSRIQAMTATGS